MENKVKTVLVIVILLISSLSILSLSNQVSAGSVIQPNTNLYVNGVMIINESTIDPLTGLPGQYGVRGNLIVNSTGTLIIENATLYFDQDVLHHYKLIVNGTLIMYNAEITVSTESLQPYLLFNASFFGANVKIHNSIIKFPGNVYFQNSNVLIVGTKFSGIQNATSIFNNNRYSFAPTPFFSSSTVYLVNDYFGDFFSPTPINTIMVANLTSNPLSKNFTGTANFSAVQSSLNYPNYMMIDEINLFIVYKSNSESNVSIFTGKYKLGNSSLPSTNNQVISYNLTFMIPSFVPLSKIEESLYSLIYQNNSKGYTDIISENFEIYTNDTFSYYGGYSNYYINLVNSVIYGMNDYFDVNFYNYTVDHGLLKNPLKNGFYLVNSNIYIANLTVNNATSTPLINQDPPFLVDQNSNVLIYRYIELNLTNYQGYPINHYDAVFYPNEGSASTNSLVSSLNNNFQTQMISMGFLSNQFNYTINGIAKIPVLTDVFNFETNPNTNVFGKYILNSEGIHANVTLPAFPLLSNSTNLRLVNIKTDDTFVNYWITKITEPIYGSNFYIYVNATSFGSSISGNFVIFLNSQEYYSSSNYNLPANSSTAVVLNVPDSLSPGLYNMTLQFFSQTMFSSNQPIKFSIVSHSNVSVILSGAIVPTYSYGGSWISGYGGKVIVNVTNTGSQSTGTFNLLIKVQYPNGTMFYYNSTLELSGSSSYTLQIVLPIVTVLSNGTLKVMARALLSENVYPANSSRSSLNMTVSVIPRPVVTILSFTQSQTPFIGMPLDGLLQVYANEPINNLILTYDVNGKYGNIQLTQTLNGQQFLPINLSANLFHVGYNYFSIKFNNSTQPYVESISNVAESLYFYPNYSFKIGQSSFILNGNISNYVNFTNLLFIVNTGFNFSSQVPVEILYNGQILFMGNVSSTSLFPINMSVSYSNNMSLTYILDYNDILPSPNGATMYQMSIPIPYYYVISNLPSSMENGSIMTGNIVINKVENYPSLNTVAYLKLGSYTLLSYNLGNISLGSGTVIPITFNTSDIPGIMHGQNQISYPLTLDLETSNTTPYLISYNLGTLTIYERPNFSVTNMTISPAQLFEGENFNISFTVVNDGGSYFKGQVPYKIVVFTPEPLVLLTNNASLSLYAGESEIINVSNLVYNQPVVGTIQVYLNYNHKIFTKNYDEYNVTLPFNVLVPKILFTYSLSNPTPTSGQSVVLVLRSINTVINKPWPANFSLTIGYNGKIVFVYSGETSSSGIAVLNVRLPYAGKYTLTVVTGTGNNKEVYQYTNFITAKQAPLVIPIYVYPLVILGALGLAFVAGASYIRRKTSNLMQCSVCGALIPADSLKCPRCGTEFEKDMVKCSECSSWIPENSKYCPNCGAVFLSKKDPEYQVLIKLKADYDKFVNEYRAKAKIVFGEKMSEQEFQKWWKSNPEYKGFREWLTDKGVSPDLSNLTSTGQNKTGKSGSKLFKLFRK